MQPCGSVSSFSRFPCLVLLLLVAIPALAETDSRETRVRSRAEFSSLRREQLAEKLRKITGWSDLRFDQNGILKLGKSTPLQGSATARNLLNSSVANPSVFMLEDASNRKDVVFCQLALVIWRDDPSYIPVHIIQIDFADFDNLIGDQRALRAFDVGWGFLHEFNHIISDSGDSKSLGEVGDCETLINQMRRELGLPERSDYLFTDLPLRQNSAFTTRFVRLPFDQKDATSGKARRYWLTWDATVVGDLTGQKQIAALK